MRHCAAKKTGLSNGQNTWVFATHICIHVSEEKKDLLESYIAATQRYFFNVK
jgi:hypothetical protein